MLVSSEQQPEFLGVLFQCALFVKSRAAIYKTQTSVINKDQLEIIMDWIVFPQLSNFEVQYDYIWG